MRYAYAIAALVVSGLLLLLGIGQRTFLAGPAEIEYSLAAPGNAPYSVMTAEDVAAVPGQANVVLEGAGGFVATGADRDIEAWVAPFDHAEVAADTGARQLAPSAVSAVDTGETEADGKPLTAADPRGSDLWLDSSATKKGDTSLRVPLSLAEGQSLLVASDGTAAAPEMKVVWVQDRQTPWAGPLFAAGGLFALVGLVLYLLAVDRDRRSLGPQRGRRGPLLGIRNVFTRRPKSPKKVVDKPAPVNDSGRTNMRRAALPALGLTFALGLSGCSANYWPQLTPSAIESGPTADPEVVSNAAPVPVTEGQISRIIGDVSKVATAADTKLDAKLLAERFSDDALVQRKANYTIRKEISDYGVLPPQITDQALGYQLVQSTEGWPRTLLLTVESTRPDIKTTDDDADAEAEADADAKKEESDSASPSLAMILTQQSPHENFLVSRVISLRGGIDMPPAAPVEEGTALLSSDLQGLVLPPGEVGEAFASVLQEGKQSKSFDLFETKDLSLLKNYGLTRAKAAEKESEEADTPLSHSVRAKQGGGDPVALSTGVGGALVATTVIERQIVEADGGRYKPQASGALTALSGLEGQQDRIVQVIAHELLFFVPNGEESEKIQLLGETSELIDVTE